MPKREFDSLSCKTLVKCMEIKVSEHLENQAFENHEHQVSEKL